MPALTIADLDNGKRDVDLIAEVATSEAPTAVDRLGHTKMTVAGAMATLVGFNYRGQWQTATAYAVKDQVTDGSMVYVAVKPHTSTSISADLAAGKLAVFQGAIAQALDTFEAGTDFTPGSTTSLVLSRSPGPAVNLDVFFDGFYQGPENWILSGTTLTFSSPIPGGTSRVHARIGSTLATLLTPDASVDRNKLASDVITYLTTPSLKTFAATGDGITDDAHTLATADADGPGAVILSAGTYLIDSNATLNSQLIVWGGKFRVNAGKTLTLNGPITAGSKVIFEGDGTVIVNQGIIDVAWFDGTDASSKWDFCRRGIQNTNGLGKVVCFSKPAATDAWATVATYSGDPVWGPRWKVDSPIIIGSKQQATRFLTPAGFVATSSIASVFQFGESTDPLKVDYCHFPDPLMIDGAALAQWAAICHGSSHLDIPYQEIYRCGGWLMTPGMDKQCSDIKFGFIDTGALRGPAILADGSAGPNNTITDIVLDFVNSTGFASGFAPNALLQFNSNYNAITIGTVVHRAVTAGTVDATGSIVSFTNVGATPAGGTWYTPWYGITVGSVINGSSSITAKAIAFADQSGGLAAKFKGVTIGAGSLVNGGALAADIDLDFCEGIVVQGLTRGRKLNITSTAYYTDVYGVDKADVIDNGVGTLINGHNYGPIVAPTPAPVANSPWVNNFRYTVLFTFSGAATVTGVTIVRGGVSAVVAPAGTTAGAWPLAPGDNITVGGFTGSPAFKIIPQ